MMTSGAIGVIRAATVDSDLWSTMMITMKNRHRNFERDRGSYSGLRPRPTADRAAGVVTDKLKETIDACK